MKLICALSATASAIALSGSAVADINPWDFNVFSRSTIGTSGSPYGSDYQGAGGAVGAAYFSGFGLRTVAGSSPSLAQSWYGGATLNLSGQIYNGGVESAGTVTLNSGTVLGTVFSGGNLAGTSGSVSGSANLAGTYTAPPNQITVSGGINAGVPFAPTVNLAAVSAYFLSLSNFAGGQADNTTYSNINGGAITVNAPAAINYVTIPASELNSAYGFTVNGPGVLIVNVSGASVSLDSTTWTYQNGASSSRTLLNYNSATSFQLSGGNIVNILAPNAAVHFSSGHVDGNLIVGGLTGSGQVNWTGSGFVPTPSAAGLLALGGAAALRRRRL